MTSYCRRYVEVQTKREGIVQPDPPTFVWEHLELEAGNITIKVIWIPALDGATGSHFFVKYRIKSESSWTLTHHEEVDDFVIIGQLLPSQLYEMVVVSVDGEFMAESPVQEIRTKTFGMETNYKNEILEYDFIDFITFQIQRHRTSSPYYVLHWLRQH